MNALEYLKRREWSMGSGQCPECCGCRPDLYGDVVLHMTAETIGHERECELADALRDSGVDVLWRGEFVPTAEQEKYAEFKRAEMAEFQRKVDAWLRRMGTFTAN